MKIYEIIESLSILAPPALQEDYDNSGLLVGRPDSGTRGCLISLDVNESVIEEAVRNDLRLVVSHHPIIFKGLKRLTGSSPAERTIMKAIREDVAIYAVHTNLDNIVEGVNGILGRRLNLGNTRVLQMKKGLLKKLVTFCPLSHAEAVRNAIFDAGAGHIGQYDRCSFNTDGQGTFRAGDQATPFVGNKGDLHFEVETRIETIFPAYLEHKIVGALLAAHPYEEVAYDIYPLDNDAPFSGAGLFGDAHHAMSERQFLEMVKDVLQVPVVRHSPFTGRTIEKVAICGGSGSFLIQDAIRQHADVFLTADLKYHQFQEADGKILLVDAGHYETEQFSCDLLAGYLKEKFPNFAVLISKTPVNPVNYF